MTRKEVAIRNAETVRKATETVDFRALMPKAEQVRSRAYEIYCERCEDGRAGDALTDWITAEGELTTGESRSQATTLVGVALQGSGT